MASLAEIQALIQNRDFDNAVLACESTLQSDGESVELLYLLGLTQSSLYRFKDAARTLRRAAGLKPVVEVIHALAEALYRTGDLDEASSYINRLIEFNPSDPRFIELRGKITGRAESGVGCRLEMVDLIGNETSVSQGKERRHSAALYAPTDRQEEAIYSAKGEQRFIESICGAEDFPFERVLVDIGAGDGMTFSNSLNLLDKHRWSGLLIEASHSAVATANTLISTRNLQATTAATYANPDTIRDLLSGFGIPRNFGFLSLDVDSIEYPLLQAILAGFRPGLVCVEINERIPPPIVYYTKYIQGADLPHAPLYLGASIQALVNLFVSYDYCCLHLEYNNLFAVPAESKKALNQTLALEATSREDQACKLFHEGYRLRPDRLSIYPWNRNFEDLQTALPEEIIRRWSEMLISIRGDQVTVLSR